MGHDKSEEDPCKPWWIKKDTQEDQEKSTGGLRGRFWIRDPGSVNLDFSGPVWLSSCEYPGEIPEGLKEIIASPEGPAPPLFTNMPIPIY